MHFTALLLHRSRLFGTMEKKDKRKEIWRNTSAKDSALKASECWGGWSWHGGGEGAQWAATAAAFSAWISPFPKEYLLLVNIPAADDLVYDPVENVKNEEDEWKGDPRHRVNALGAADEELAHLLHGLLRWHAGGRCVVVALDGHAVFGLQTRRAHAVGGKAEAPFACLLLLQHTHQQTPSVSRPHGCYLQVNIHLLAVYSLLNNACFL